MIRFLLRTGGMVLLAAGVAALVADGARSLSASRVLVTTVGEWAALGGWTVVPAHAALAGASAVALDFAGFVPGFAALVAGGLLLLAVGRPRPARIGFARR